MAKQYRAFVGAMLMLITAGAAPSLMAEVPAPDFDAPASDTDIVTMVISPGDTAHIEVSTLGREGTEPVQELHLLARDEILQRQLMLEERQQDCIQLAQADIKQRQGKDREAWEAYQKGYALVLEEKWKEAAAVLSDVERKHSGSAWADDAGFWNIYSLERGGRDPEEIVRMYDGFLQKYHGSTWTSTARTNLVTLGNRLATSGKPEYAAKVRSLAEHDQIDVSLSALIALQNMGEDSLPDIMRLYETNSSPEMRERIVASLNVLATPKEIDFLIRIAETDPTPRIRHQVLNLFGARIAPAQPDFVVSGSYPQASDMAVMSLRSKSRSSLLPEEGRTKVIEAMRRIYKKDSDENVRAQAIYLIARSAATDSDLRLAETAAKSDPSYTVRNRALMGLWSTPDKRGIPAIIAVAKSNSEVNTRKAAIRYLGQSKDPRARAALVEIAAGSK